MNEIYKKDYTKNIGQGIKRLKEKGKYYLLITELERCGSFNDFEIVISHISYYYFTEYKEYLISNLEYIEMMEMAEDIKKRKEIINNIIIYSCLGSKEKV
ncbi:hypothetical protein [Clostridium beijerinckii]|uniref:Uncharacterized protein n=1 Tax=Clostridium beijerinckii TaxID=1520 RepID=A0AAW3W6U8_CLOBE|nr:hypothetical protein [Clostridium beijerinckii]MBC2457535.1 hypothetical protein [Clostridium beijerinckii]MBC2474640.1 hypothetical protein [Clostridium beijerinckii]NOV62403.1 hypothetical protein [Clostridium beijerinckii]NOV68100.1 hypothetical protein [Clostridium beijerinckii]NOW30455.1 hypothetical protein [Clostridium beijerinckii]